MITDSCFLCGYFSAGRAPELDASVWQRNSYTAEELRNLQNYYFPEFAQCLAEDIVLYTHPVDQTCTLDFGDEQVPFYIDDLRLWVAPFHIVLYAVHVRFEKLAFNQVTRALNALRNCAYYNELQQPFVQQALAPIVAVYTQTLGENKSLNGDLSWLVESGNKFKLFQVMQVPDGIEKGDEDLLLFDAATLAKHTPLSTGINSATYIENTLAEHKISVFAGWTGLALLDTCTLVATNTPEHILAIWEKDYFEKIYVYQLFRKVFLYSVNLRYRRRTEDIAALEQQLDLFEQRYSYTAISYNFLPNIINAEIEKSLNTQRDYDQLNKMINKEIETRQTKAEERTNNFLTFLTCLTIFSAIYDFASLLNDSFGYETIFPSGFFGFRLVGTILLLLILLVYLFIARKNR